jgi:hypothetical protein
MSLSSDELVQLMAYIDGQVDEDEVAEVEALIARSAEARHVVADVSAVGAWMREASDQKAAAAGADKIADLVMAEAEALGGAKVITLERERARRALNRQRVKEFSALAAVAAALTLLWLWPAHDRTPPVAVANAPAPTSTGAPSPIKPGVSSPTPPMPGGVAPADSSPALAVGSEDGVDVENVESAHNVSVFYLPVANKNAASVVVWIGEEENH